MTEVRRRMRMVEIMKMIMIMIMVMIMSTLPEGIWRHQSRQWQRWEGGWGWWGIVRPLSNCKRGRNPGSTGYLAFPCNEQFFCRFWFFLSGLHSEGGLYIAQLNTVHSKFPKFYDLRSIISIFQHLSSTSSLPEDFSWRHQQRSETLVFPKRK